MNNQKKQNNDPGDLINWAELSRLLSGNRSVVTKNRSPKIHSQAINDLIDAIQQWCEKHT